MIINKKILPDFLIVGAQKAATTTLFHILKQHPALFLPANKEPTFFCFRNDKEKAIALNKTFGYSEKNVLPMTDFDAYSKLFEKTTDHQFTGEASTHYLYDYEKTIKNIKEIYGDAYAKLKIIIVLRNPIGRAFSAWSMLVRNGLEELDFLEAIKQSHRRKTEKNVDDYDYLGFSMYYAQVKAYKDNFKHVKILIHEDVENDINTVMNETLTFLELEHIDLDTNLNLNRSGVMKNKTVAKFLYTDNGLKTIIKKMIPQSLGLKLKDRLEKKLVKNLKIEKSHEEHLKKLFKEDVNQLSQLIGRQEILKWID